MTSLSSRFLALLAGATAVLAVGCGEDELRGTPGELGTLRFEHSVAGVCAGCGVDREVLAGSLLELDVHGVHPRVEVAVRSTTPDVAEFQVATRCRFIGEENCRDGIVVVAKSAGDANLEVYDAWTETVLDRITLKVRQAASLESVVRVSQGKGSSRELRPNAAGVFELTEGSDVDIVTTARSATGAPLIATSAAIRGAYANASVVGPRPVLPGPAPTELARAKSQGTATVVIAGDGAREELVFRVDR